MQRLLNMVTVTLICVVGVGLGFATPISSNATWHITATTHGKRSTTAPDTDNVTPAPVLPDQTADTPQTAADGFDQYFGIPDGMPDTTWAVKQGWGTSGSQAVMSSTGLVGTELRYVVVVLASAPADSYSTVPAVVTAGASALAGLVDR